MAVRPPRRVAFVAAIAFAFALSAATAVAQVPEKFENLKVFPEDVSKEELLESMRQFCFALGVRCTYCHIGAEDNPDRVTDYKSDDKPEKRKARAMLEMVRDINGTYLAELPERAPSAPTVRCATCHGGIAVPEALEDRLSGIREKDGVDAAIGEYRTLRERYLGTRAYDFGTRPLLNLAETLSAADAPGDAAAFLELNREMHPESAETVFALGKAYEEAGRTEDAAATYRAVIEMAPDGWWAKSAGKALEGIGAR